MVSADPIRMFLYRWMIETGDPVEVIAKGFELETAEIDELLSGDRRHLTEAEDASLRSQLHLGESCDYGPSRLELS